MGPQFFHAILLQLGDHSVGSLDLGEKNATVRRDGNKVRDTVLVGLDELDDVVSLPL
jgi:hypothetical protein